MAVKVVLPLLGQTMEEGTIIKWFKQEGEKVEKGEPLLEVQTDKVNMEVESPDAGMLLKIVAPEEAIVPVKELIAVLGEPGENIDDIIGNGAKKEEAPAAAQAPVQAVSVSTVESTATAAAGDRVFASPRAKMVAKEHNLNVALLAGKGTGENGRIREKDVLAFLASAQDLEKPRVTPLAGKVAADQGIDLSQVAASGIGGKITKDDVLKAAVPAPAVKPTGAGKIGRVIPFTGMRKAVADNVDRSFKNAHVTLRMEVDMTEAVKLRKQILDPVEKKFGVRISFTDIITKAAAMAMFDVPIVNATFDGQNITIHDDVNISIAVAIDEGLTVPVVRNVESKGLAQISMEIKELAGKARNGQLPPNALQGGTFTISNLGSYGVEDFDPIINPPQSAILGVCKIVEKPVAVNGQIEIRPMMNLNLTFDHRVMDGAPAAQYLAKVKEILEAPYLMLA